MTDPHPIGFDADDLRAAGMKYGEDYGICDMCGRAEPWADLTPDWNGDTGNHLSCEERALRKMHDKAAASSTVHKTTIVTVKNLAVHVVETDEGVVVDIYPNDPEYTGEPLATTYAFDAEGEEWRDDDDD